MNISEIIHDVLFHSKHSISLHANYLLWIYIYN